MIYIVIPLYDDKMVSKIEYIFMDIKISIIINSQLLDYHKKNNVFIFFNKYFNPLNNFITKLNNIITDKNINFCYLIDGVDIFFVRQNNVILENNIINIKKTDQKIILFEYESNKFDHIIPSDDINVEYVNLLKLRKKSYDSMINFNNAQIYFFLVTI